MSPNHHLIGLLLGAEEDWPQAFEAIAGRLGVFRYAGADHVLDTERVHIHPFNLRDRARHDVVIDRLAYWYYHPREWLKKVALMDDVYLPNSPFTFQSMEKHSAYCALIRLGMNVPDTVLVPHKNPVDNVRWAYTSRNYNDAFDLVAIADEMGYPLFMKPFDGGGWRGVSRVRNQADLMAAYDNSGEMLMHLQKSVEPYDVFARALTIGPETMVMHFQPDQPMHQRYVVDHDFLSASGGPGSDHHHPDGERLLPLGVQLLRDVGAGRHGDSDRLRQCLSRRGRDLAALLLPVGHGVLDQMDGVLRGNRSPREAARRHRAVVRGGRRSGAGLRQAKLDAVPAAGRPALPQGALSGLLRHGAAGHRRHGAGVGDIGRLRPDAD